MLYPALHITLHLLIPGPTVISRILELKFPYRRMSKRLRNSCGQAALAAYFRSRLILSLQRHNRDVIKLIFTCNVLVDPGFYFINHFLRCAG